jgi:hypothetical protein
VLVLLCYLAPPTYNVQQLLFIWLLNLFCCCRFLKGILKYSLDQNMTNLNVMLLLISLCIGVSLCKIPKCLWPKQYLYHVMYNIFYFSMCKMKNTCISIQTNSTFSLKKLQNWQTTNIHGEQPRGWGVVPQRTECSPSLTQL